MMTGKNVEIEVNKDFFNQKVINVLKSDCH